MILKLIGVEEESFSRTIDQGMAMLNEILDKNLTDAISGEDAFRLNDTYGFPLDLTREIAGERVVSVDEESCMAGGKQSAGGYPRNGICGV